MVFVLVYWAKSVKSRLFSNIIDSISPGPIQDFVPDAGNDSCGTMSFQSDFLLGRGADSGMALPAHVYLAGLSSGKNDVYMSIKDDEADAISGNMHPQRVFFCPADYFNLPFPFAPARVNIEVIQADNGLSVILNESCIGHIGQNHFCYCISAWSYRLQGVSYCMGLRNGHNLNTTVNIRKCQ